MKGLEGPKGPLINSALLFWTTCGKESPAEAQGRRGIPETRTPRLSVSAGKIPFNQWFPKGPKARGLGRGGES